MTIGEEVEFPQKILSLILRAFQTFKADASEVIMLKFTRV